MVLNCAFVLLSNRLYCNGGVIHITVLSRYCIFLLFSWTCLRRFWSYYYVQLRSVSNYKEYLSLFLKRFVQLSHFWILISARVQTYCFDENVFLIIRIKEMLCKVLVLCLKQYTWKVVEIHIYRKVVRIGVA